MVDFQEVRWRIGPLMRTVVSFAEGVAPVSTWWGRPLTMAQLRKDPFKDPAGAHLLGIRLPSYLPELMKRKGYR